MSEKSLGGKALAALGPPPSQNFAATNRGHARPKSVAAFAHDDAGLECALHGMTPDYVVSQAGRQRPSRSRCIQSAPGMVNPGGVAPLIGSHTLSESQNRGASIQPMVDGDIKAVVFADGSSWWKTDPALWLGSLQQQDRGSRQVLLA